MPPRTKDAVPHSELEAAYIQAQQAAVLEIADQGLVSLAHLVETGAIDVAPKFQRRDRWDPIKQSLLIESFLTNIPVPPVYLAEDIARLGSYAVIDGKQRLTAISTFFSNNLVLRGLTRLEGLNGLRYEALPIGIRNPLGMKNLRITTLLRQSDENLKHEVFLRLNTGGEVLNAQEIRNVAYRGPLNELIYTLAENEFLRTQLKVVPPTSPAYRQMRDAEFVLRFFALSSGWQKFRGDLRPELDKYMLSHRFPDSVEVAALEKLFNSVMTTVEAIWGTEAFKRPGRDQAISGLFDAQLIALGEVPTADHPALVRRAKRVRAMFADLFDDAEFDEAIRLGTNTPARLRFRVQKVLEVFSSALA